MDTATAQAQRTRSTMLPWSFMYTTCGPVLTLTLTSWHMERTARRERGRETADGARPRAGDSNTEYGDRANVSYHSGVVLNG